MLDSKSALVCRACGTPGTDKFCDHCGQMLALKRITVGSLLHDVFHLFTHLDKGILFTLKQLIVAPGKMQREYIDGDRARHQKPFALFFICATIAGLSRYWIYLVLIRYFGEGEMTEANFFHNYMVLVHVVLIPVYALITFLVFYNSRFNYAEIGVFLLYTISAFFLIVSVITLLRFIWPGLDTMYVELPVILLYNALTCANFFKEHRRWIVVLKSIVAAGGIFFAANLTEELVQRFVS